MNEVIDSLKATDSLPVGHDAFGNRRADARKRGELLGRPLIEVHGAVWRRLLWLRKGVQRPVQALWNWQRLPVIRSEGSERLPLLVRG